MMQAFNYTYDSMILCYLVIFKTKQYKQRHDETENLKRKKLSIINKGREIYERNYF